MKTVTAAIIIRNNALLIARRGPNEKLAGYWELPGGKVEGNESLSECLRRELLEELDIYVEVDGVFAKSEYFYEHGSFLLVGIKARIISGSFTLCVHDQIKWADFEELDQFEFAPADIPIINQIVSTYK